MARTTLLLTVFGTFLLAGAASAGPEVPAGPFRSLTAKNGSHVVVRHGPAHRVTLLQGDAAISRISTGADGRLVLDRCPGDCPPGYRLRAEVTTPALEEIAVEDGGSVEVQDRFPGAPRLAVAVRDGGTIDARGLEAETVAAAVRSGGRIFTRAGATLAATIAEGGIVTYWGRPRVRSTIQRGGVVVPGSEADAGRPLCELGPDTPAVPPVPAVKGRRIKV